MAESPIYAPTVLDGWRGALQRSWMSACDQLISHMLVVVTEGAAGFTVDGERVLLSSGAPVLVCPGSSIEWDLQRGVAVQVIVFGATARPLQQTHGMRFDPVDGLPEAGLEALWGVPVPRRLPASLAPAITREICAIGDLWWRGSSDRLAADAHLAKLLAWLHAALHDSLPVSDDPWVAALHWAENRVEQGVGVAALAAHMGMTRSACSRGFRLRFGVSPGEVLRGVRQGRARRLLETTDLPVTQVALHCGYRSRSAFEAAFVSRYGSTPGSWPSGSDQLLTSVTKPADKQPASEHLLAPK